MKNTFKSLAALILAVLMFAACLPVNAIDFETKSTGIDVVAKGSEMTDEAKCFWNELEKKELKIKSVDKAAYMNNAYELVKNTGEVTDLKWEDEDTFSFTLSNGVPCVYDYKVRMADLNQGEGIDTYSEVNYNDSPFVKAAAYQDSVLFAPWYGYDSSFDQTFYVSRNNQAAAVNNGTARKYTGSNATPQVIREEFLKDNIATMFFDAHGICKGNSSYFCAKSAVGIESSDYSNGWAISMGSGTYGIDGRYMTRGGTIKSTVGFCWFAICEGMMTRGICDPLRQSGVSVVYGYSQSVTFSGDYAYANVFWSGMYSEKTVAESIARMKQQYGNYDPYGDAYPVVVSDEDNYPSNPDSVQNVKCTWLLSSVRFTVTYDANGGEGAPSEEFAKDEYSVSTVLPQRFGYVFKGWSTNKDASAAEYLPTAKITLTDDITLYAVWEEAKEAEVNGTCPFSIEFPAQAVYAKMTAVMDGKYIFESHGTNVDLIGQLFDLDGNVLTGNDDGGENSNFKFEYKMTEGQSFYVKMFSNTSLTGQFELSINCMPNCIITYDANGGEGAPDVQNASDNNRISSIVPTNFPYDFAGWAFLKDAEEADLMPNDLIVLSEDTTLYAVWREATEISTGSNTVVDCVGNTRLVKFVPEHNGLYEFNIGNNVAEIIDADFNEIASGTGLFSANLVMDKVYYLKLYGANQMALEVSKVTYTLTFDANNGKGAPEPLQFIEGDLLTVRVPERFQYTFIGWSKDQSSTTAKYVPGKEIIPGDATVYAVWQRAERAVDNVSVSLEPAFLGQIIYIEYKAQGDTVHRICAPGSDLSIYTIDGELIASGNDELSLELMSNDIYYIAITAKSDEPISFMISTNQGKRGDANGDGVVNTADAVSVLRYVVSSIELSNDALILADINCDGVVNTADAVEILKTAASN